MTSSLLVTGATGRLGEAAVRLLAERGDRLLLTGRNAERLAELEKTFGEPGVVEVLHVDVSDPDGARRAAALAAERFDGLSGLVHLVGTFDVGPLMLTDVAAYQAVMASNFYSAVVTSQAVLPHLTDGGRLVFFGSPLAAEPMGGLSAYAAAKAALEAWVRSISHEVKKRGVHANLVSLTLVDTPEMRRERPGVVLDDTVSDELVARVIGFLTSEAADGLYGSVVPVVGKFGFASSLAGGPPAGRGPR
ncbi:SDR family oxidoreductase [Cryptosporangium minutisporangium]|uniref:Ketoreductase domain-containing protein n=1 Tax=Cryptosporangium minutisporangium TaxID=113569 RepID=A0ABP6SS31_9ACTN